MDMFVPDTLDGLDTAWFAQAWAIQYPRAVIANARIIDVQPGTCTKIRVELDYGAGSAGDLPRRMIVKGGFEEHSALMRPMHETEAKWYARIAGRAPILTPRCYLSASDPQNGRSLVVLEDLAEQGVEWQSALDPFDRAKTEAFLDGLADLSTAWWDSAEFRPGGALDWVVHSYEGEARTYMDRYLEPEIWDRFMALPRCACLPGILHDRERMRAALEQLALRLNEQVATLAHGDTHPGNLYRSANGTPGFFDAQPRRAPWVKDFAYNLVSSLDIEDRRAWERPLLDRHLARLRGSGVADVPDFDEAWADYRGEIVYGLFIFMINDSHFQREEINTAYAARFGMAAIDHDSFASLGVK